jgi:hypothetical protein
MRRLFFALSFIPAFAGAAQAQEMKIISLPDIGAEATVAAGGDVYSYIRMYTIKGAQIDADTRAGSWLLKKDVPSGTKLVPVATKAKFKACVPYAGSFEPDGPCFLDDDGDGVFDRQAGDDYEMATKLKQPVPYSKVDVSIARADSFKRVILFQGATSDSLRFSYREFSNDMARPAFTEELSIPREPFPAMVMVKNLQLEVLGVSGMGLRYRIVAVK